MRALLAIWLSHPTVDAAWPGLCLVFFQPMLGGGIASGWRPMPAGCGGEYEARRFTPAGPTLRQYAERGHPFSISAGCPRLLHTVLRYGLLPLE
jgi:hypothetical protein